MLHRNPRLDVESDTLGRPWRKTGEVSPALARLEPDKDSLLGQTSEGSSEPSLYSALSLNSVFDLLSPVLTYLQQESYQVRLARTSLPLMSALINLPSTGPLTLLIGYESPAVFTVFKVKPYFSPLLQWSLHLLQSS